MLEEEQSQEDRSVKRISRIILITILILIIAVIATFGAIVYLKSSQFTVQVDGKKISAEEDLFLIDEDSGKVYVDIKQFASYVGYTSHDGEYKVDSQDSNKCYVESANETASFFLNSNKISKVIPNSKDDYDNYTISEPVRKENGKMYSISDGIEKAFNVAFSYSKEKNSIEIYTLNYLVDYYNPKIVQLGYAGISDKFNNQKAILYDMFVVQEATSNDKGRYGVIDINNNEIIALRYSDIQFNENNQEFLVTNNQAKTGIMLKDGTSKIRLEYDEIKVMDRDLGYYVVKNNNKYGVINNKEQYIIHLEYDGIGIDVNSYPSNKISNQYLLFDNVIPVKQGNKWGLFNKSGERILSVEYDSIGCIASTVKDKIVNNLVIIPDIEGIVICKDKKYGLITSTGIELLPCALNVMYSITDAGIDDYFMNYSYTDSENKQQEVTYNVIEYLKELNIIRVNDSNNSLDDNKQEQTNNNVNTQEQNNTNNVQNNVQQQNYTNNVQEQQSQVQNNNNNGVVQSQVNDIVL